jgi:hypothetical protein
MEQQNIRVKGFNLKSFNRRERDTGPGKRRFNTTTVEHLDFLT